MITPSFGLTATERVLPRLALDWTTGVAQPGVDVARAGVATFVGANSLIQTATADTQRVDYSTGVAGLLVEESRTNIVLSSGDLTASTEGNTIAAWAGTSVTTATANAGVSPDGTNNATKVAATATTAAHSRLQTFNFTSGVTYTVSVFAKAAEWTTLQINFGAAAFSGLEYGNYVLTTGASTAGNGASIAMTNVGSGWYRCSITVTATATALAGVNLNVYNSVNPGRASSILGDGTSGILMYGAQLEAGAFPTSYIPTAASQVTRTADVATMTGTNFSDWFNASEGTFAAETLTNDPLSTSAPYVLVALGDASNRITMHYQTSTRFICWVRDAAAPGTTITFNSIARGVAHTATLAYKANDTVAAINAGAATAPGTQPANVPACTQLTIGHYSVGPANFLNGHIRNIMYWPQRLTNAEVQAFSK
jgi:hypothetical protein